MKEAVPRRGVDPTYGTGAGSHGPRHQCEGRSRDMERV